VLFLKATSCWKCPSCIFPAVCGEGAMSESSKVAVRGNATTDVSLNIWMMVLFELGRCFLRAFE
jgi:hypothetical protein